MEVLTDCDMLPVLVQREIFIKSDLLQLLKDPDIALYMVQYDMIPVQRMCFICIYNNIPRTLSYILTKYDTNTIYPGDTKFKRIIADMLMKNNIQCLKILLWNFRSEVFALKEELLTLCSELYHQTYKFKLRKFKNITGYTKLTWYILDFYDLLIRLCTRCNVDLPWDMFITKIFVQTHHKYRIYKLLRDNLIDNLVHRMYDDIHKMLFIPHELLEALYRLKLTITWDMVKYNKYQFARGRNMFVELADKIIEEKKYLDSLNIQECFAEAIKTDDFEYFSCLLRHSKPTTYYRFIPCLFLKPSVSMIQYMHQYTFSEIYYNTHMYKIETFYRNSMGIINPNANLILEFLLDHTHVDATVYELMCLAIDADNLPVFKVLLQNDMTPKDAHIPYNYALSVQRYRYSQAIKNRFIENH